MKAIIWIIVIALVIWGIWWFVGRDNTPAGIPSTGSDAGQVEGASDMFDASSTAPSDTPTYDGKG
jgi:hypothetical protein